MKKILLDCGVEVEVNEEKFKDMRLVDDLTIMNEGGDQVAFAVSRTIDFILGNQKKEVYKAIEKDGVASIEDMVKVVVEIMEKAGKTEKKS